METSKDQHCELALQLFWPYGKIVHQPVQVLDYIILKQRVHSIKITDNSFQSGVVGRIKHLSSSGFKPIFTYPIIQADHFNQTLVNLTVVCLYCPLKRPAKLESLCKFSLRITQSLPDFNNSLINLVFFFSQCKLPVKLNFIKYYGSKQEKNHTIPLDNIYYVTYHSFIETFFRINL